MPEQEQPPRESRKFRAAEGMITVLDIDPENDVAYLRIKRGTVVQTKIPTDNILIDYDQAGNVLGIELIGFGIKQS